MREKTLHLKACLLMRMKISEQQHTRRYKKKSIRSSTVDLESRFAEDELILILSDNFCK